MWCCLSKPANETDRLCNVKRNSRTKATNKLNLPCQKLISRYSLLCFYFAEICSMLLVILSNLEQADGKTSLVYSSSVPKYLSPNSPMPGMTRKSLFKPISISDVTIFILGNRLQTIWTPWGAEMRLRNMMFDSGTPFSISKDIACTAEFPVPRIGSRSNTFRFAISWGNFS